MADTYVFLHSSGRLREREAIDQTTGASEAGQIIAADATGRLHESFLPAGVGADIKMIEASENLSAGDFVNVHDNAGAENVRRADGASEGTEAVGFVLAAVTSGNLATVHFSGINDQLTSLTAGVRHYLSATTPGAVTATAPTGTGQVVQYLGTSASATEIPFTEGTPVTRA